MFESGKSRRDFIMALKGGRINPQLMQKAIAAHALFADCPVGDFLWTLTHGDANIRRFGAEVLAVCRDPAKVSSLLDLIQRETRPGLAEAYLKAMAVLQPEEVFAALGRMINNKSAETRKNALNLLIRQKSWFLQRNQVIALMEDPQAAISEAMIRAVTERAARAYASHLRQLSHHPKPEIRAMCLQSLIAMNNLVNAELFLERLPQEGGEVKKALFEAIVTLIRQEPTAMTEQIVKAIAATEPAVSKIAMDFFVKLPDKRTAFGCFLRFANAVSAMMRDQLFAEAARRPEAFVDPVLEVVKTEKDPALRLQAMNLARTLKNQRLAPIFLHELKNSDWLIRYTAMQTLGQMKSTQALPALVEALGNPETSIAAVQALNNYKDIRLAKPFFQKLQSANESEQVEILAALKNIGDGRLLGPLSKFLESNAPRGKAKKVTAETIIALCEETGTVVPARVLQVHESLSERKLEDLPDLGLKMAEDR